MPKVNVSFTDTSASDQNVAFMEITGLSKKLLDTKYPDESSYHFEEYEM